MKPIAGCNLGHFHGHDLRKLLQFPIQSRALTQDQRQLIGVHAECRAFNLSGSPSSGSPRKPSLPTSPTSTLFPSENTLRMDIIPVLQKYPDFKVSPVSCST